MNTWAAVMGPTPGWSNSWGAEVTSSAIGALRSWISVVSTDASGQAMEWLFVGGEFVDGSESKAERRAFGYQGRGVRTSELVTEIDRRGDDQGFSSLIADIREV